MHSSVIRITSAQNALVKDVRKAAHKGSLTSDGLFLAETPHLVEEALRSGAHVEMVIASQSATVPYDVPVTMVPDHVFESISTTRSPQGVMALVHPRGYSWSDLITANALVIVLDAIQDPGNAGSIVRAAEAFGATGVVFLRGTASPYHPKTVRATAGSIYRVPILHGIGTTAASAEFDAAQVKLSVAQADAALSITKYDWRGANAIVVGSEGAGPSPFWKDKGTAVAIPTQGVESLNVALAAGILLYEARRQRLT